MRTPTRHRLKALGFPPRLVMAGLMILGGVCAHGLPARSSTADQSFPPVDAAKVRITLARLGCGIGRCPQYSVTIEGSGRVVFNGGDLPQGERFPSIVYRRPPFFSPDVVVPGQQEDRIAPEAVAALVRRFRDASFFTLADSYVAQGTDQAHYSLTLDTGAGIKHVEDYAGTTVGMPTVVRALEEEVDRVANTARWVEGAPGLVDWLAASGFDFTSTAAAAIALHGPDLPAPETILGMIDRGLPLETVAKGRDGEPDSLVGLDLLRDSLTQGRAPLFQRLAATGWLARLPPGDANHLFAHYGAACDADLTKAAVAAGIPVDATTVANRNGRSTGGQTALARVFDATCKMKAQRLATVKQLLALGADPNHRDNQGRTPLFEANHLVTLDTLLAAGADATIRDKNGLSAVFSTWDDAMVARLLEKGASPDGRYLDGRNLVQQARAQGMTATSRWLAAHGRK